MPNPSLTADQTPPRVAPSRATLDFPTAARGVHRALNLLILLAVPVQFYFAGFAIFGAGSTAMHAQLGNGLILVGLLSMLASFAARGRARPLFAFLLLLALVAQPILAFVPRASAPALSALHPVVGLAIAWLALRIERGLNSRVA